MQKGLDLKFDPWYHTVEINAKIILVFFRIFVREITLVYLAANVVIHGAMCLIIYFQPPSNVLWYSRLKILSFFLPFMTALYGIVAYWIPRSGAMWEVLAIYVSWALAVIIYFIMDHKRFPSKVRYSFSR